MQKHGRLQQNAVISGPADVHLFVHHQIRVLWWGARMSACCPYRSTDLRCRLTPQLQLVNHSDLMSLFVTHDSRRCGLREGAAMRGLASMRE